MRTRSGGLCVDGAKKPPSLTDDARLSTVLSTPGYALWMNGVRTSIFPRRSKANLECAQLALMLLFPASWAVGTLPFPARN